MKQIIIISGKRTSGKDTITDIIIDYLREKKFKVCQLSFGGILKENFSHDCKFDYDRLMNDYAYKESHRDKMIEYFTNMRNTHGNDYFSKEIMKRIDTAEYDFYIISDLRLRCDAIVFEQSSYNYVIFESDCIK